MIQIIAEIGQAHEGSLGMAHAYIDAVAKTGCSAIKFQTHIAEAESSIHEPFRVKFSKQDATRFEYWKRMEFTLEQWKGLKVHCDKVGIEFLSSPFSNAAVDLLEKVGVKRYKVGSGEVNNFVLLEKIARTGKPMIISSGMSSFEELDKTVAFLKSRKVEFSILQCTTSYPTIPEQFGLNMINEFKERYGVKVGFSDHSASIEACIAATTLGAEILEFHVVFNKEMFGPDVKSSLTMSQTKALVKAAHNIKRALENPTDKKDNKEFKDLKNIFEKSLAVNKLLKRGHIICFEDLETKKPKGSGILPSDYNNIIGKQLNKGLQQWDFLNYDDLSN
jgi:N,N'-diacetyllegionaminate synthase